MGTRKLLIVAALTLILQACVFDEDDSGLRVSVGDPLPRFVATLSDGTIENNVTLSRGRVIIVFFNTTCSDCRRELPELEKRYRAEAPDGVRYLCIAREEAAGPIAAYWAANSLTMPWSPQPDRAIYSLFATSGIPLIISATDGTITHISRSE